MYIRPIYKYSLLWFTGVRVGGEDKTTKRYRIGERSEKRKRTTPFNLELCLSSSSFRISRQAATSSTCSTSFIRTHNPPLRAHVSMHLDWSDDLIAYMGVQGQMRSRPEFLNALPSRTLRPLSRGQGVGLLRFLVKLYLVEALQ